MGRTTRHQSIPERAAGGRQRRQATPRAVHRDWVPSPGRPDPVALIEEQNLTREPDLVPVRHARMLASPLTFYRGAAKIMAADLKDTARAGLDVQLCGDAHLSNFGVFASPERTLVFDLNDFDETLPGPFEYDVLRMAASFTIAARHNMFSREDARGVSLAAIRSYREAMRSFAQMGTLDIWYARQSDQDLLAAIQLVAESSKGKAEKRAAKLAGEKVAKAVRKARSRDSLQALSKLAERVDGTYRIVSQPPIIIPVRELEAVFGTSAEEMANDMRDQLHSYRQNLQHDRRQLLERFEMLDVARKVVGVGSVGTRAFIVLLQGRDSADPLFLQVKEATRSVLEDHLPRSAYRHPGARVVQGQRRMQAASDIFLGWTKGVQENRYLYWRQLRDMKGSAVIEGMRPMGMGFYARACGWTLARAHARSGDPIAIAAYLGKGDVFDESVADFCDRYADQNERDYEAFSAAVRSGRVPAAAGS
ncbi:DUF2252 domain-containing protein [Arthrobacter caoxuetaonis]|uniref:DUF2252 domain-containing protein n=1 Tax=Arthrobacter caoxuetaonis TaxID=2886935 RepID=A0A9X1SCK2_9MICC|nr:DUF2252 domain-containing protein [Arthrobacter caoxuetaonis]MCC3297672.1 DUF2252 domain-containing protein [Arthrobacter caoxuetaonis]USQ56123.1 DUF2252 domain-containing protein [Arthrobacter caoxuetaonis]